MHRKYWSDNVKTEITTGQAALTLCSVRGGNHLVQSNDYRFLMKNLTLLSSLIDSLIFVRFDIKSMP
jgi:hypothetical protein